MPRVLIIEDDRAVRDGLLLALRRQGHEVAAAATGEDGLEQLRTFRPEAVVLDLMLPGMSGLEVCRRIRAHDQLPIIMATARGDDTDIVVGLESGADDYVVKPVRGRVLDARIRAVLRRVGSASDDQGTPRTEHHGDLVIDRAGLTVTHQGRPVALGPSELRLLLTLSASAGQVFSRQQLLEAVWEHNYHGDARLVDACVKRLRSKIGEPPGSPRYVHTVRGFGYRFGPR
ncbi:response regulator transcription factor [Streptomyces sp. G3]|jgi:DNA-binding response OmpR family regulator|uniref:Response regulator n=1 Tax=Streptomyces salinarius TaxID=2762598 RepID=A0ABW8B5I2_9ACTN|nr:MULTISPECIES: response regulator transcription factor [Streptomyces]WSU05303.1 response regulator transcription factor [Streptomyces sp. NBC_01124]MBH5129621.1 response regulator transcription factor [Streptomyces sp. HB-N217]MCC8336053.1 response regulator transcription factor [Streptomyces sp. R1]MCM1943231.1 response regulator transcription factor [Streptomyces sp. G3]MCV2457831.1 response regulator transcription factor [Streptomyces sp. ICN988]